jgi:putative transposase
MALDQSALTELLDALRSGGELDLMREAMEPVLQALIDLEATKKISAARYERSDARTIPPQRQPGLPVGGLRLHHGY